MNPNFFIFLSFFNIFFIFSCFHFSFFIFFIFVHFSSFFFFFSFVFLLFFFIFLHFSSFVFYFYVYFLGCSKSVFLASIASRFLALKKRNSCLGEYLFWNFSPFYLLSIFHFPFKNVIFLVLFCFLSQENSFFFFSCFLSSIFFAGISIRG